jgi:hypothetical protein
VAGDILADHPSWRPDGFGRVILIAPPGPAPENHVAIQPDAGCSRSAAAKLSREFAGSGIDFSRPLPAGVSLPPPGPEFAMAKAQGALAGGVPAGPTAAITASEVSSLTGGAFVGAVLNSEDLGNSFFDITSADTLAALAEARVQEIVTELGSDLAADPIANAGRLDRGLYFLRAAAYVDSYSAALSYSAVLKTSVNNLLVAVGQNPQFLAAGFLAPRAEWAVVIDSWMVMPGQVTLITSLLRRYLDTPALQNASTSANRTEGAMMYSLLNGMARTANQDPNWVGNYPDNLMVVLGDLALTLPDNADIDFVILNAIYVLGRLRAGEAVAAYQGQAHQIISQVLSVRALDSAPYLEAMMALELAPFNSRLASGAPVDVAGYREQLAARVFSNTYSFDGGSMMIRTPLDAATAQQLYDALREDKAQFFRVTQALRPIDSDPNASLTLRIYGARGDYVAYQRFLYGLGTDNGGMYIEDWATFFTYQRTSQESIYTLEELTRHEYVHYLDGYYLLVPSFGDSPWYDNNHLTWHSEGFAEFLAGSRRTKGVPVRANQLRGATAAGSPMSISQIIGATYESGFGFYPNAAMFFVFMHERHPELHWRYFQALYSNDITTYDTLTQGWRGDAALQAEYTSYLTAVSDEITAGTRQTAEDIPTGYKPDLLYGVTTAQIQADIQSRLPAGTISAAGGRFHFSGPLSVTVATADATTPERFQAEFGRQLDSTLEALTPLDAHYQCATAWFEQLTISGQTASATVHLESWYNANTAPALVADAAGLTFDSIFSDDATAQTLLLNFTNMSSSPLLIESATLAGADAGVFELWWDPAASLTVAGRGTFSIQVSVRLDQLDGLAPGTHTATLNLLTANGTPALVQVPISITLAAPVFVDGQAPAGGNGQSWSSAFQTIGAAIAAAPTGNETILVAAGTYPEAVVLRGSLHLYGGFSGLNGSRETRVSQRRPEVNVTTVAAAALHVVDFSGTASALVDGFTISGGQATNTNGGGVFIAGVTGTAVLRNCLIEFNQAGGSGGGVYIRDSTARLEDCSVLGNTATYGGGVAVSGSTSSVTLANCWIAGNDAAGNGSGSAGGLHASGGQTLVENSQVVANTADSAGGFQIDGGSQLTLRGTLIAANVSRGWFGGGANYWQSVLLAEQCVFFRNLAGPGYGFSGLGTVYGTTSTLRNCIVAGHQDAEATGLGWGESLGILDAGHCLFFGNTRDFTDGTINALGAAQLNALTGVFLNAFDADPQWHQALTLPGTVTGASYNPANGTTLLTLSGAALTPGSLRAALINKGATAAASVLTNTATTITVFGQHDTLAQWSDWQPLDFRLTSGSPAIDVGMATGSVLDGERFPRGLDLVEVANGPGTGFDLGLYEHQGMFGTSPLLRIEAAGTSAALLWPLGLPGWSVSSSTDLRHWTPVPGTPSSSNGSQKILRARTQAVEFYRLQNP